MANKRKMTLVGLRTVLSHVNCEIAGMPWKIACGRMGPGFFVQLRYIEADIETGNPEDQHGRKWYVSSYSVRSEIVQTVLKACLTSAEHMIREHFLYRGQRIFGPHFDVDQMARSLALGKIPEEHRK